LRAPGLERRLVDDEPRRDRHDLLDRDEVVLPQRVAGRHEVDDRVGQPDERRELHRAVQPDEVHVHALVGEVLARGGDVLGRDAQPRTLAHRRLVVEALLHRHHHAAGAMPRSTGW
jgi:hypothetical protein